MANSDLKKWRNNRSSSLFSKFKQWTSNPIGASIRLVEFIYFGQPLINFFIGRSGRRGNSEGIDLVSHISKSINTNHTDENMIFLENVRVELQENFIQLDTGHVLNTRKTTNELFSGQYWSRIRKIRKSRSGNLEQKGVVYPLANQKYFFHFLLEELPEIISAQSSGLVDRFISFSGQPKYVMELTKIAGVEIEIVEKDIAWVCKLICPTYSRANTAWSIRQLQTLIKRNDLYPESPEKILLLRKSQVRSDVDFENSLLKALIPKGFQYINLDHLSNSEQINLFANAKIIVAVHGAALSNIVFSKSDCSIFEIFNHPYRTYFFRDLAEINGNQYSSAESPSALEEIEIWLRKIR